VGTALRGAREFTPQLYCCSTAAAKKNDGGRLVIPQGLQIGFSLEWNRLLRHDASRVNHLKVREKTGYPSEQPSRSYVLRNPPLHSLADRYRPIPADGIMASESILCRPTKSNFL